MYLIVDATVFILFFMASSCFTPKTKYIPPCKSRPKLTLGLLPINEGIVKAIPKTVARRKITNL